MVIIEDTRQRKNKHKIKNNYWAEQGDVVERCALPVGDYMMIPEGAGAISVDTKAGIQEICSNLCGIKKERDRFRNEQLKAQKLKIHLVYLVECEGIESVDDLIPLDIILPSNRRISGEQLKRAIENSEHLYDSEFRFCKPSEAGKVIKEILKGEK